MDINLRIKLPQHPEEAADKIKEQVLDWIADGLFPEESVMLLENDGVGHLVPPRDQEPRFGRFQPDTNRPRPASEARRTFR